ncbi:MAG TPA: type 4a pilus biogenesis protein PilO [Vicinamibacterales bacterium]|jgi:type IV pilus assembly protein PilO
MELSLSKLPWYAQVGAFLVLAIGGVGAFVYYYELPQRAEMKGRQDQLTALKKEIKRGRDTKAKLADFEAQVEDLQERLVSLSEVLPEEKDAADLLRQMQTVATQSDLTIKSFKPAPVVAKELHAEWPINLQLDGTYHNLALFFDRVGKFTRIVNISSIDLKGKPKQDPSSTISADCVATTFVLLEKPVAPKKAGKGAAAKPAPKKA